MLRLGLTGGIGSGKSTVGRMFETLGALLLDADQIARRCTQADGAAIPAITKRFGCDFITSEGAMDRNRMREHVFSHPEARLVLESIVHPLVQEEMRRRSKASLARCLVFDIPLLVESSRWRQSLDRILVVDCTVETQIRRVKTRNGWQKDLIEAIIRQQSTRERRLEVADDVIWNDGADLPSLSSTVGQVAARLGL